MGADRFSVLVQILGLDLIEILPGIPFHVATIAESVKI